MYKIKIKNGFTLVELLAVIVVLAIIGVIAVTTVSEVLEQASINSFKSSNDILIKEIKRRIGKNKLGLDEPITCSNYGENNCNDMYDLSKDDYALSIIDLGNENYDIILAGKGVFDGIDVDGNGNSIIYTNINNGIITSRPLEKKYSDFIKLIVEQEEKIPGLIKNIYDGVQEEYNRLYAELEKCAEESCEKWDDITAELKKYSLNNIGKLELENNIFVNAMSELTKEIKHTTGYDVGYSGNSLQLNNSSYDSYVDVKFYIKGLYNGEPLFDCSLHKCGSDTFYANPYVTIRVDRNGRIVPFGTTPNIMTSRNLKMGYKETIKKAAVEYFSENYSIDEVNEKTITLKQLIEENSENEEFNYAIDSFKCNSNDYNSEITFGTYLNDGVEEISAVIEGIECLK